MSLKHKLQYSPQVNSHIKEKSYLTTERQMFSLSRKKYFETYFIHVSDSWKGFQLPLEFTVMTESSHFYFLFRTISKDFFLIIKNPLLSIITILILSIPHSHVLLHVVWKQIWHLSFIHFLTSNRVLSYVKT